MSKNTSTPQYAFIDALRGWAILAVIVVHVSQRFPGLEYPLRPLTNEGARGVQLFFVVSALTLMLSWHQRADGILPFYVRRLFRIAPLFWLAIVFFLLLGGFAPRYYAPAGISLWHVAVTSLFMHGWHPESITSVVPGGWSIAVEMTFYAIFPLLVMMCRSFLQTIMVFILSLLLYKFFGSIVNALLQPAPPHQPQYLLDGFRFFWFWSQLPIFLVGIAAYFAIRNAHGVPAFLPRVSVYASLTLITLILSRLTCLYQTLSDMFRFT